MVPKSDKLVTKSDKIIFAVIGLLCLLAIIFWSDLQTMVSGKSNNQKNNTKKDEKKDKKDDKKEDKKDNGKSLNKGKEDHAFIFVRFNPINPITINSIEMSCNVVSFSLKNSKPINATRIVLVPAHIALVTPAGNDFSASVKKTKLSA